MANFSEYFNATSSTDFKIGDKISFSVEAFDEIPRKMICNRCIKIYNFRCYRKALKIKLCNMKTDCYVQR